jgi:membrane-associated phospholipid phosphatase
MAGNVAAVAPPARPALLTALALRDRRLGRAIRARARAHAPADAWAAVAARALSPAFRVLVAVMVVMPGTRGAGVRMGAAGVLAALVARALRDRIDRRRPGARADGGFPSRHAAAAVAIAYAAGRRDARFGAALGTAALAGLSGRVICAEHEPADILAGAALGVAAAEAVTRLMPGR